MVCIFCVVVSGDGYILGGDGGWWMVVGGGWWWMVVGGGWCHGL